MAAVDDPHDLQRLIDRAAYFNLMVVPGRAADAMSEGPDGAVLHAVGRGYRLAIDTAPPTTVGGVRAVNAVGGPPADVRFTWRPIPDGYEAAPGRSPPPTPLRLGATQRFVMADLEMRFTDRERVRCFAAGRTDPDVQGSGQLRVAAVGVVLDGTGRFAGKPGVVVLCGGMAASGDYALNLLLRVTDLDGGLQTTAALPIMDLVPDPDPATTYIDFHSLVDPDSETRLLPGSGGAPGGLRAHERLTLVESAFGHFGRQGMLSRTTIGEAMGELAVTADFHPPGPDAGSVAVPIAFDTRSSVFTFHDAGGTPVGSVTAGVQEGRSFLTAIPGTSRELAPQIFGGFGPITGGSGAFAGAEGMMYTVGLGTVEPHLTSNIYILRLADPDGRFRLGSGDSRPRGGDP